ncbi:MAG TPA: sulfotransferase [Gaiellaceae bacterium]|nr:sulfotransferase [Gaiellaceae bacterium]
MAPHSGSRSIFIEAPLVLVSQISRSGGSLLAQLFDRHPQLYAHPWELRIGFPEQSNWPVLDLQAEPAKWFEALHDVKWEKIAAEGFAKAGRNPFAKEQRHPFTYSVEEQRARFTELAATHPVGSSRDVLNCYFTSFFESWGEWSPTGQEVAIAAFLPRFATRAENVDRYAHDYPDGRLITILRDPRSWYASSKVVHYHKASKLPEAIAEWLGWGRRFDELLDSAPVPTLGLLFEDLVLEPEATMRKVAAFIGIEFDDRLLEPSYAGHPVLPNSSFAMPGYGISAEVVRGREIPKAAQSLIDEEAMPLYEQLAGRVRALGAR